MEEGESVLILVDELRSEDHNTKLHAVNSLNEIADAIGQEKSRDELLPFLNDMLEDDNDEVLLALASKLGELADAVGRDSIPVLTSLLQVLASNEEEVIRERAVTSLTRLMTLMSSEQHATELLPLVKALAEADRFEARISSCGLFAPACRSLPLSSQEDLLRTFIELAHDDSSGVRRAVASALSDLISVARPEAWTELYKLFDVLASDEHDTVRQMTAESAIKLLPTRSALMSLIKTCASDRSWRVRYSVAVSVDSLCSGNESTEDWLPAVLSWLSDSETEVRSVSALKLPLLIPKIRPESVLTQILPALEPLCRDQSPHVKVALMHSLCQMPGSMSVDNVVLKLLPLIGMLLRDDAYEVRLAFSEGLIDFCKGFNPDQLNSFVTPLCLTLLKDPQWRVRLQTVETFPQLLSMLGPEQFKAGLSDALVKWAEDPVFAVREAVLEVISQLAVPLGQVWVTALIHPFLKRLSTHSIFTKRMIALIALTKLYKVLNSSDLMELLTRLAGDPVPNIKFTTAKVIKLLGAVSSQSTRQSQLIPLLQRLKKDTDFDVRYFADDALRTMVSY